MITGKIDKGTAYDPDASLSFALEIVSVSNPILNPKVAKCVLKTSLLIKADFLQV